MARGHKLLLLGIFVAVIATSALLLIPTGASNEPQTHPEHPPLVDGPERPVRSTQLAAESTKESEVGDVEHSASPLRAPLPSSPDSRADGIENFERQLNDNERAYLKRTGETAREYKLYADTQRELNSYLANSLAYKIGVRGQALGGDARLLWSLIFSKAQEARDEQVRVDAEQAVKQFATGFGEEYKALKRRHGLADLQGERPFSQRAQENGARLVLWKDMDAYVLRASCDASLRVLLGPPRGTGYISLDTFSD